MELYVWIAFSTVIYIFQFIYLVCANDQYISYLFGISTDQRVFLKLVGICYAFHSTIIMKLPLNSFAVLYVTVNYHFRCVLNEFSRNINTELFGNYQSLLNTFNSFKTTIDYLDDELSFFVLCEILYSSSALFFAVSGILRWNWFANCFMCMDRISFLSELVNTVHIVVIMTLHASLVSESYAEI